jgi:hypothetical protein
VEAALEAGLVVSQAQQRRPPRRPELLRHHGRKGGQVRPGAQAARPDAFRNGLLDQFDLHRVGLA